MKNLLVELAGILGIAAAIVHGYLGETKLFAAARIEPNRARPLLKAVWYCSVVDWTAVGVLLLLVPAMGAGQARTAVILASAAVLCRCRHRQRLGIARAPLWLGVAVGRRRPRPRRDLTRDRQSGMASDTGGRRGCSERCRGTARCCLCWVARPSGARRRAITMPSLAHSRPRRHGVNARRAGPARSMDSVRGDRPARGKVSTTATFVSAIGRQRESC